MKWVKPIVNELGIAPTDVILAAEEAVKKAEWRHKVGQGADYHVADVDIPIPFNGFRRAFFLKLKPGGSLHEHNDGFDGKTYHIPLKTNKKALIHFRENGKVHDFHFKAWQLYDVNRTLPHWSENEGKTDRVHLIVETSV